MIEYIYLSNTYIRQSDTIVDIFHGHAIIVFGYLIGPSGDNTYSDLVRSDYILKGFLFFNHFRGGYVITPTVNVGARLIMRA